MFENKVDFLDLCQGKREENAYNGKGRKGCSRCDPISSVMTIKLATSCYAGLCQAWMLAIQSLSHAFDIAPESIRSFSSARPCLIGVGRVLW